MPEQSLNSRTRDFVAREFDCCSFFDVGVTGVGRRGADVVLTVEVPADHVDVLTGLVTRAEQSRTGTSHT